MKLARIAQRRVQAAKLLVNTTEIEAGCKSDLLKDEVGKTQMDWLTETT